MRRRLPALLTLVTIVVACLSAWPSDQGEAGAPQQRRGGGQGLGGRAGQPATFKTDVPAHLVDVVLGRPTATAITISILFSRDTRAVVAYGTGADALSMVTSATSFTAGRPASVLIERLRPDTRYVYQIHSADTRGTDTPAAPFAVGSFRTQRAPGQPFVFTVTADSHLDGRTDPGVYRSTLIAAAADGPDFHVDLGDTFMTQQHPDRTSAARQYLAQRFYLGLVAQSAPLFLALGNHDAEGARWAGRSGDSLAVWAHGMRTSHFPCPAPDDFYSGNTVPDRAARLLEDYYAWRWGDALFVVLDPFWYSAGRQGDDGWTWTLGLDQYRWLTRTLEQNRSPFVFVFIHHLVGGGDRQARGGAEASRFFEWGGADLDGTPGFARHRPGWPLPIHDLLVEQRVTAVFHGHDHLYARQQRDGLTYQEVPQPGSARGGPPRDAAACGYVSGTILGGPGYLRVTVRPAGATVDYVSSPAPGARAGVADSYVLRPAARPTAPLR
jgi:hypothetical protein